MRSIMRIPMRFVSRFGNERYARQPIDREEMDDAPRNFRNTTPGFLPAHIWQLQRNGNEILQSKLFPTSRSSADDLTNELLSTGIANISGMPVDENLRYDTYSNFKDLPLCQSLLDNIINMQLSKLTPIQLHTIPILMRNAADSGASTETRSSGAFDLMAAAQTGSGKTLAYLLPILNRIMCNYPLEAMEALTATNYTTQYPSILIMVPTRELVNQIRGEASKLCYRTHVRPVGFFGGEKSFRQISEINRGCHVAIATPGRLLDFLDQQLLNLSHCRTLIIDEADRMLDMGFEPQLRKILQSPSYGMPQAKDEDRQTALFSATFPRDVALLAKDFLRGPKCISLNIAQEDETSSTNVVPIWGQAVRRPSSEDTFKQLRSTVPPEIVQNVEWIGANDTNSILSSLSAVINQIMSENTAVEATVNNDCRILVFCNTKMETDRVDNYLMRQGLRSVCVHGGKTQEQRTKGVQLFRDGRVNVLVATSIAARGLDFPHVKAVINFHLPLALDDYVHRIGRTGRMGKAGQAFTLVSPGEISRMPQLQQVARGICRLVRHSSKEKSSNLPTEFVREAGWNEASDSDESVSDSYFQKSSNPRRSYNNQQRSFPPNRRWN